MNRELPHDNCYWVVPGRVIAGEYPGAGNAHAAAARVRQHLEAGVRCFIDLTGDPDHLAPYRDLVFSEASRLGVGAVEHHRFHIEDWNVPGSPALTAEILDTIDRAANELPVVYLHCWGGIGRTGTIVGCYFVRHGRSGEEALAEIARLWSGVAKSDKYPESPQTPEQFDYVRNWTEPPR